MKATSLTLAAAFLPLVAGGIFTAEDAESPASTVPASRPSSQPVQQTADKVRQALRDTVGDPARGISVTVHGDTIILTGKADSEAQAATMRTVAQDAAGSARISDQIEVQPAAENAEERRQTQLVRQVEAALRADPSTAELGVAVSIDDAGVIGLHGLVPSGDSRTAAERVASRVTGGQGLRNHLAIPGER